MMCAQHATRTRRCSDDCRERLQQSIDAFAREEELLSVDIDLLRQFHANEQRVVYQGQQYSARWAQKLPRGRAWWHGDGLY